MWETVSKIIFFLYFTTVFCKIDEDFINQQVITTNTFAIWENATVPFYVDTDHFDHEQTMHILTALSMFAFKTCVKFMPVMAPPTTEDVLVFQNPDASRRCVINTHGHSVFKPHVVDLGYDCLKSPQIDMMIMKALGFTFEHNRISRDNYIEVLQENIEPGAIELFTKEDTLPMELRFLPYDINSVMHFDTREYSKNGHRTIIFKDHNAKQVRLGLTPTDLKKIEIIYGPHCRNRDRQEKIELCQSYPGVARKKREVVEPVAHSIPQQTIKEEELVTKSLRVNPDITPPPESQKEEYDVMESFKDLGIDDEVQKIVENTYKIAALALKNARVKYCNGTEHVKPNLNHDINNTHKLNNRSSSDILGIIEVVGDYARDMVNNAMNNLTKFCEDSGNMEVYQRAKCDYGSGNRCPLFYRSTKSGYVKYSTQHRPVYYMSTKNHGNPYKFKHYGRSGNDTEDLAASRRKREAGNNTEVVANVTAEVKKVESNTVEKEKPNEVVSEKTTLEVKEKTAAPEEKKDNAVGEKTEAVDKKEESGKEKDKVIPLRMGTEPPAQKQYLYDRRFLKSNKRDLYESNNAKEEIPKKKKNAREDRKVNKKQRKSKKIAKERKIEELTQEDVKERPREEKRPRKGRQEKREREKEEIDHSKGNKERKKHRDREAKKSPKEDVEERKRPRNRKEKKQHRQVKHERKRPKNTENVSKDQDESPKKLRNKNRDREDSENYYKEADAPKKHKKSQSNLEPKESGLPETVPLSKANLEFYKERKWPDGIVYFMIQEDTTYDTKDLRRRIEEVNRILKKKTCVKLVEITPGQANKYEDYIYIDNSPDYITGRVGGKQKFGSIEMFRGDQHRQHTAMMVMAMLGFYFEVGRHDRDEYVRVHMRHVRPDKLHHFEKIRSDATLPLPYDYASATHPAWQFWRQLGHSGISTVATFKEKDPDGKLMKSLGQNSKLLSDTDIIKINSVYGVKCFQKSGSVDEYSQMGIETVALPVE